MRGSSFILVILGYHLSQVGDQSLALFAAIIPRVYFSSPSNLSLGKRWNPGQNQVESNDHAAHYPHTSSVVGAFESEQNGKDDASKVTHRTDRAAENTVGVWVHVRHQSKVRSITSLEEESHARNQAEHHRFVVRIRETNGDEKGAGGDADKQNPCFLEPKVRRDVLVEEIADDTA